MLYAQHSFRQIKKINDLRYNFVVALQVEIQLLKLWSVNTWNILHCIFASVCYHIPKFKRLSGALKTEIGSGPRQSLLSLQTQKLINCTNKSALYTHPLYLYFLYQHKKAAVHTRLRQNNKTAWCIFDHKFSLLSVKWMPCFAIIFHCFFCRHKSIKFCTYA